jgi:hypothetical protein
LLRFFLNDNQEAHTIAAALMNLIHATLLAINREVQCGVPPNELSFYQVSFVKVAARINEIMGFRFVPEP